MKFVCNCIDDIISFDEGVLNSIVIENQSTMRYLINDLYLQIGGLEGDSVLSINDRPCDMKTYCELITSYVDFDLNKKSLLTKIIGVLEATALDGEHYYQTQKMIAQLEKYVEDLSFEHDMNLEYQKLSFGNLLKGIGIVIRDDYDNALEKLIDYLILVREYEKDKLFVLVNMRSFFNDEELELFSKTVLDYKLNVLLVDNIEKEKLYNEKRIVIDADNCVFNT